MSRTIFTSNGIGKPISVRSIGKKGHKVVAVPTGYGEYEIGYWTRPEVKSGWVLLAEVPANLPDNPVVVAVTRAVQKVVNKENDG